MHLATVTRCYTQIILFYFVFHVGLSSATSLSFLLQSSPSLSITSHLNFWFISLSSPPRTFFSSLFSCLGMCGEFCGLWEWVVAAVFSGSHGGSVCGWWSLWWLWYGWWICGVGRGFLVGVVWVVGLWWLWCGWWVWVMGLWWLWCGWWICGGDE